MTTMPHPTVPPTPVPYEPLPEPKRFNARLWIFVGAIALVACFVGWSIISPMLNSGISDHGNYKEVDLKMLGNYAFNDESGTVEDVPKKFRALDGQRVMLQGYMYGPEDAGAKGRRFQFVYNVTKCCFSGPPQVQERVFVVAKKDIPIYDMYTFAEVVGTLHVRVIKDPTSGKITSVYDLDCESAKAL
jgi:hypothetical protein